MRRYDDPVEVRKGLVTGSRGAVEGPELFLWRGRLWKVRDIVAHWVETGAWWEAQEEVEQEVGQQAPADLLAEREVWRVEAGRGAGSQVDAGAGVFDLVFDGAQGGWQLARCVD